MGNGVSLLEFFCRVCLFGFLFVIEDDLSFLKCVLLFVSWINIIIKSIINIIFNINDKYINFVWMCLDFL